MDTNKKPMAQPAEKAVLNALDKDLMAQ